MSDYTNTKRCHSDKFIPIYTKLMRRTCQKIRTIDQIYDLSIGDTIVIL